MRRFLRLSGIAILTLFSLDFLVWLLDYITRWDFIKDSLEHHPKADWFVHTPYVFLVLLVVGFASLFMQYKVRQPYILARYINARLCPDLHSATVQAMFDTEQKKPGWDTKHIFDWNWFVELRLVNDSDAPTTVHEIEVKVKAGGNWFLRHLHLTRRIPASIMNNVSDFQFYHRPGQGFDLSKEVPLPALMKQLKDKPLERGIGHEGWVGIHLIQANQREMNNKPTLYVWVIDAYGRRHEVHLRSRKDERNWDMSFDVVECL